MIEDRNGNPLFSTWTPVWDNATKLYLHIALAFLCGFTGARSVFIDPDYWEPDEYSFPSRKIYWDGWEYRHSDYDPHIGPMA